LDITSQNGMSGFRYRVLLASKSRRNHRQRASGQRGKVGDDASAASGSAIGYEALLIFLTNVWRSIAKFGFCAIKTQHSITHSSFQDNQLPSPSGILPTIQSECLLQIPIRNTTTTTSPGNNLNTLVSPLETETRSHTTPAKLNSVSTENLPESVPNESNSEHSIKAEAQQFVKRKSRNRRKRPKVQKPDIEIKRVPHRSRNATPTEITTDDEDITYDVEDEEELEQDPTNKFTIDEDPFILPKGYLRALTPSRYRNYRE
ncbi:hypothetical protein TNCV_3789931, partial [Trichonephila clavipes]